MSVESPEPVAAPGRWQRLVAHARTDARRLVTTGVPHLFVALAFTQGISLIRRVLLTGILTLEELGQMTYVTQIADLIAIGADLGITTAVLKFAAEPVDDRRRRELYIAGFVWSGTSCLSITLLYVLALAVLGLPADAQLRTYLLVVAPYIPLAALARIPLVLMQAVRDIRRSARYTAITQAVSLVLLVGATWLYGLPGFFATLIVAPATNLALLLFATRGYLRWIRPRLVVLRQLLSFGFFSVLANLAGFANVTLAVVILKSLTGSDIAVGIYSIGLLVANATRLLPMSLLQTAFPYMSGLVGEPARLRRRMWELSAKQALVLAGVFVLWLLAGRWGITLVWGAGKAAGFEPGTILMLAVVCFGISSPAGNTLLALGRVRLNFLFGLTQLGVNVAASFALVPRYGACGAAAAVALGQLTESTLSLLGASAVLRRAVQRHSRKSTA